MHINDVLFLLTIPKQDQELSPCSCSGLSLPGRGHVLVRCSHTVTGLRTLFLFLPFLDLLWNSLVPFTPYWQWWNGVEQRGKNTGLCFPCLMKGPVEPKLHCTCRVRYRYCCPYFITVKKAWPKACSGFHCKVELDTRRASVKCPKGGV